MELGLKGKVAIVTGGARGIGATIVESFVNEGANVIIADTRIEMAKKLAEKLSKNGVKVLAVKTDVAKKPEVDNMVATTIKEFGKIDILVNDAGVGIKILQLIDLEEEDWDYVNDTNAKGTYLVTRAILSHMISAKYGKIINFSSFYGREGYPNASEYCCSKFGVIGFTQAMAKELAEYNINVNAVSPGIVRTPMWEGNLDILSQRTGEPREQIWERYVATIPLKRPQTTEDIANVVLFLSSEVSRNIIGEAISINGGLRMD